MRSFAIVICRVYFEAQKHRKYAKNVVVKMSASGTKYHIHVGSFLLHFDIIEFSLSPFDVIKQVFRRISRKKTDVNSNPV